MSRSRADGDVWVAEAGSGGAGVGIEVVLRQRRGRGLHRARPGRSPRSTAGASGARDRAGVVRAGQRRQRDRAARHLRRGAATCSSPTAARPSRCAAASTVLRDPTLGRRGARSHGSTARCWVIGRHGRHVQARRHLARRADATGTPPRRQRPHRLQPGRRPRRPRAALRRRRGRQHAAEGRPRSAASGRWRSSRTRPSRTRSADRTIPMQAVPTGVVEGPGRRATT